MALAWICGCFGPTRFKDTNNGSPQDARRVNHPDAFSGLDDASSRGMLQHGLCTASQERLIERRAKALVATLRQHLGPQAIVRLYGLSGRGSDRFTLVLLASSESPDEETPGSHLHLPWDDDALAHTHAMLRAAATAKVPITYPAAGSFVAALPLLHDQTTSSVLWMQRDRNFTATTTSTKAATAAAGGAAAATAAGSSDAAALEQPCMEDRSPALQQVAISASLVLAAGTPGASDRIEDLASSLRRMADSTTLKGLVSELSSILTAHVRRHFCLDAAVRVAVVPTEGSCLAFLLEEEAPPPPPLVASAGARGRVLLGAASLLAATTQGQVSLPTAVLAGNGSGDPAGEVCGGDVVDGGGGGGPGGGALTMSYSSPNATRRMEALGPTAKRSGSCYEPQSLTLGPMGRRNGTGQGIRRSSSEMNLRQSARAPPCMPLPRPMGHVTGPPETLRDNSRPWRKVLSPAVSPACAADCASQSNGAAGTVALAALRAKPFRLSDTVLQAMIQQGLGAGHAPSADKPGGEVKPVGGGGGGGDDTKSGSSSGGGECGVGVSAGGGRYGSNGVLVGDVVPECLQYVQSIRLPSRDVYMLLTSCGGGGGKDPSSVLAAAATAPSPYDSPGTSASPVNSGARGRFRDWGAPAGPPTVASCADMPGCTPVNAGAAGGGGGGAPASAGASGIKALLLLGIETDEGEVMALYVSFPVTLPRLLLETIRNSCAGMLDAVLAAQVRRKLRVQCASELETLAAGVPGNYVILPSGTAPVHSAHAAMWPFTAHPNAANLPGSQSSAAGTGSSGCNAVPSAAAAAVVAAMAAARPAPAPAIVAAGTAATASAVAGSGSVCAGGSGARQRVAAGQWGDPTAAAAEPHSPGVTDSLGVLVQPSLGGPGSNARVVRTAAGILGTLPEWPTDRRPDSPGGVTTFKLRHRSFTHGSPSRTHSARHLRYHHHHHHPRGAASALMGLWGSGETSQLGLSGAQTATTTATTTNGMLRGICPGSGATGTGTATSALLAATFVGSGLRRMDTAPGDAVNAAGPLDEAALLTLLEADGERSARMQLGLLVESLMSTLRDSALATGVDDLYDLGAPDGRPGSAIRCLRSFPDDLEELSLNTMVGTGASGVVLMGKLATVPVAVKLMELPGGAFSEGGHKSQAANGGTAANGEVGEAGDDADGAVAAAEEEGSPAAAAAARRAATGMDGKPAGQRRRARVEARRTLLRSATELAVLRSVSHINIVQVYAVYSNVALQRVTNDQGLVSYKLVYRRRGEVYNMEDPEECPPCVAVCMEFADCGSLEGVLGQRSFPRWLQHRRQGLVAVAPPSHLSHVGELGLVLDLKGVYLTLLEIALALRHLHSRRLVHRDVKPANILLKGNPTDPRGWNCKLADFGFALVLDQQRPVESGSNLEFFTVQEQACGTVTHMAPEAFRPGARIDASVDIFSLGVVMWELVAGRGYRPYKHMDQAEISPAVVEGMRPIFPEGLVPPQYSKMAQSCWLADPARRPTAADVVAFAKAELEHISAAAKRRRPHVAAFAGTPPGGTSGGGGSGAAGGV